MLHVGIGILLLGVLLVLAVAAGAEISGVATLLAAVAGGSVAVRNLRQHRKGRRA